MKLSFKFFLIAYMTVLLSVGVSGIFMIKNVTNTLWKTKTAQADAAKIYAADSFLAFADISYGDMSDSDKSNIIGQIKKSLGDSVMYIDILSEQAVSKDYSQLGDNHGMSRFIESGNSLILESTCRLNTGTDIYYLSVYSDFTDTKRQCRLFWDGYSIAVLLLSAVSGLLLFILTKKVTSPLNKLTKAADDIASGSYGKTVTVKSSDREIAELSQSFNSMSVTVAQKIKEIENEARKRDMFVADFTHEIKTPMTAIIGYAEMLNSYELEAEEKAEAAQAIYNEGRRLEKLSIQLLELYLLKNEKPVLCKTNLSSIAKQLEATLKFLSVKYGVSFSVKLPEKSVMADEVLLLSLIYNLADNAFKASVKGSEIQIYATETESGLKICVKDNGRGISPENISLLTEPFFREDTARSRKAGGAGLGLALSKEIADIHGTRLDFKSEIGNGTEVSFELNTAGEKNEKI